MTRTLNKNRRILVIDDNQQIHGDFRKILLPKSADSALNDLRAAVLGKASQGLEPIVYEVDSALQGQDGVAMASRALGQENPYALAFVDMRMPPGWDGIETIENLWKVAPETEVVICTAYSDYSWEDIERRLGQSDRLLILKKPFDNAEVRQQSPPGRNAPGHR